MRKASLGMLVAVGLLSACSETLSVELSDTVVELDAFSGRPNPQWRLTEAESAELERRLTGLGAVKEASLPESNLGYRGFWVRAPGVEIQITGGLVIVWDAESYSMYRDAGVEELLLAQAAHRGYGGAAARD